MLHIFDFDDTLVFTNKGITVPRQTFHKLRQLKQDGHIIAVISYNPLLKYFINALNLAPLCDIIHYDDNERYKLVQYVLNKCNMDTKFVYYDDRIDNIENVKSHYPNAITYHIHHPVYLYKSIHEQLNITTMVPN